MTGPAGTRAPAGPRTIDDRAAAVAEVCAVAEQHAEQTDRQACFPVEALTAMRRTGLLGLLVPERYDGAGAGPAELVDVTMAIGRADMSAAMVFTMHCQQVAAIARYGGEVLRAAVLPRVAAGDCYLASVTTEPGKGGHLLTSRSPVQVEGDLLRIDRQAPVVTGGTVADGFLVTTMSPDATSPSQVDLVYADRDQLQLEVLGGWQPMGMRATESVPMRLTGAVPANQVIGGHGGFRTIATTLFGPLAHLGWSAAWLGTAAGALSRVVAHLRGPQGRGQFDPRSELLLLRLAAVRSRLETVHALLRHTLTVVGSTSDMSASPVQSLLNTLKIRAAEDCYTAVHELIDLVGLRHGYLLGSPLRLERAARDLRSASLNYANDRLRLANGSLTLLDSGVHLA